MPRKKPFSGKQKKKQMQEKKHRTEEGSDDDEDGRHRRGKHHKPKPDSQATDIDKRQDPHRYRLQFYKESNEIIKQRKKEAMQPFTRLPEKCLEVDMDVLYKPGSTPDIPTRPAWDYKLTKHQLEIREEKIFKDYVDKLFENFKIEDLSYFELNLETWRQLWRVLEMSDILLLISDIRHPMLNFSPALYHHVTEELSKPLILVLNKVDLAPPGLVIAWREYLIKKFPKLYIVCFSSFQKFDNISDMASGSKVHKRKKHIKYDALGPRELWQACDDIVQGKVDLREWKSKIETDLSDAAAPELSDEENDPETVTEKPDYSYVQHELYKDGVLTIGCIGYPNVGKSSLINGLMGKKVVSVSKTPGHTKHFQTIFLTPTVKLCDCPGLVFPSLVEKSLQILAGIYPIAQVRDPYTPIGYLAQRIDLPALLRLVHPEYEKDIEQKTLEWSAVYICEAWAEKRRFYTSKAARPDISRAANHLLRITVDGRIQLCFRPPGYTDNKEYWEDHEDSIKLQARSNHNADDYSSDSDNIQVATNNSDAEAGDDGDDDDDDDDDEEGDEGGVSLSNPFAVLG
ncbi:guanine nucleotide-binding protein-like 1 [Patella vulgata]|uniref:guanine nucleotide-binding protein-like 1 n=1 Tax=Patella vulgata TaxID=6465 RepID=UPI0024A9D77B|nr:guanine nucleotide-binding protein-like 1 [Patella vulgata]